jgi:hypothetical protein
MSDLIFNRETDKYIFTGSKLRSGTASSKLTLTTSNTASVIDLCNNGNIDISATNVFIGGLKVVTSSSEAVTTFGSLQLTNDLDVSGTITSEGGIIIGTGNKGGKIYSTVNLHELVIDPFAIDADGNTSDASGQVVILGDLIVRGNTTTIHSSNLDISDIKIKIASGSSSAVQATNAGLELGDGYASLLYNSNVWTLSGGKLEVTGNILPKNNISQVPVSFNTFTFKKPPLISYIGTTTNSNTFVGADGYDISRTVLSPHSYIKIEYKVKYTASPEADQTLSFQVKRGTDGTTYSTVVFEDVSLGSNMGVTINNIYNGTFLDDLEGSITTVYYKLFYRRDCPANETIDTSFGIQESIGNYILLQELYRPDPIT